MDAVMGTGQRSSIESASIQNPQSSAMFKYASRWMEQCEWKFVVVVGCTSKRDYVEVCTSHYIEVSRSHFRSKSVDINVIARLFTG